MRKKKKIPKELIQKTEGFNNENLQATMDRLSKGNTYRDLSTIWITPTRGKLLTKVVSSWMNVVRPMNQPFYGIWFIEGDEVGVAYEKAFQFILESKEFANWKYILTCEEDNTPPPDALMKLYESIELGYDCVGALYFTKGFVGQPMIYGNPSVMPKNFVPQVPLKDTLQHCNGLGMGFNLWRIESLRKKLKDMPRPWFRTINEPGRGFTQDLWFYDQAAKHGFRVACDTRIRVGHVDVNTGEIY